MVERNKRNRDFTETRTPLGVLSGLAGLIAVSVAAAALIVAAVTPAIGLTSVAATSGIDMFDSLPNYLEIAPPSQKSNIYATKSDGTPVLLASFYDQNRIEVGWQQVNQYVKDAVIAGEDPRFYDHGGVDAQGTLRAAIMTATGRDTQGGSSIAQQYVKNVLVQQCELMKTKAQRTSCYNTVTRTKVDRKLKEMRLAIGLEKRYTKDQILLGYLNIAGFGGTVYGIEAAAEYYYSTTAAKLTLPQAASLIAIVNNPVKFEIDEPDSKTNGAANKYLANTQRRDYILQRMLDYKKITRAEYDAALKVPVTPAITEPSTGCQTAKENAYFCDYVTHILQNDPTFGADADTRMLNFRRGGYEVYTTLDLDLQAAAVDAIAKNVPSTWPGWQLGGIIDSVQVGTGRVLAMAQNKSYSQDPATLDQCGDACTALNYSVDEKDGGTIGFQPGSSYKVYTLAEWLKEGHGLSETVSSSYRSAWGVFRDSCEGNWNPDAEGWHPRNDDSSETNPRYSALTSTILSVNTGYVGMAKKLDLCGIRKTAEAFGVHTGGGAPLAEYPSTVLGTNNLAPLTQAVAYAGIANNGVTCTPIAIDKITDRNGKGIPAPKSTCTQSVAPEVAGAMHYAMSRVMTEGTGVQSRSLLYDLGPNTPVIGKTGTTDGNANTWMVGASTKVATAAALVSLDPSNAADQRHVFLPSGRAAEARHRMWPVVMAAADAKYGGGDFTMAGPGPVVNVPGVTPPSDGGSPGDGASPSPGTGSDQGGGGGTPPGDGGQTRSNGKPPKH